MLNHPESKIVADFFATGGTVQRIKEGKRGNVVLKAPQYGHGQKHFTQAELSTIASILNDGPSANSNGYQWAVKTFKSMSDENRSSVVALRQNLRTGLN